MQKYFYWRESDELMKDAFVHQAGKHITNVFKTHRGNKTKPDFVSEKNWKRMHTIRSTDPKMVHQAEVNKKNRSSKKSLESGSFRGGSRKFTKWVEILVNTFTFEIFFSLYFDV